LHQIAHVGVSDRRSSAPALSYLALKLFSKNSNRCEKHTSTSQTDGQTDGMQSHNRALRSIAR